MDGEFERALAQTRNPVLVADDERRYVDCNEAALELLGMSRDELLQLGIEDLYPAERRHEVVERWEQFLEQGGVTGVDTFLLPGGRRMTFRFGAVARVSPGRHLSIFLVNEDRSGEDGHKPGLTAREP